MALLWEDDDDDHPDRARGLGLSLLPVGADHRPLHPHRAGRAGLSVGDRVLAITLLAWFYGLTIYTMIGAFDQWGR